MVWGFGLVGGLFFFLSSPAFPGRKCLNVKSLLQLVVCMLFGVLILFLLTGFPCKLAFSIFIHKCLKFGTVMNN